MDSDYRSRWLQAIPNRFSTRKFNGEPISGADISDLEECEAMLSILYDNVRISLAKLPDDSLFTVNGGAPDITGASYAAAFIGESDDPFIRHKIGMAGEKFILEATYLELKTCWVGDFNKNFAKQLFTLGENEKIYAVCPIGISDEPPAELHSDRKEMDEICEIDEIKKQQDSIRQAIELARIAPSSANRQSWFFEAGEDYIKVSLSSSTLLAGKLLLIDLGIAAAHIEIYLSSSQIGLQGSWEFDDDELIYRLE